MMNDDDEEQFKFWQIAPQAIWKDSDVPLPAA